MQLSLLIPGLLWSNLEEVNYSYHQLRTPNLHALIKRSSALVLPYTYTDILFTLQHNKYATNSGETTSLQQSNVKNNVQNIAANTTMAQLIANDHNITDYKHYLIAEPTHLQVDRDRLLVNEPRSLQISTQEAQTIIDSVNQYFANEYRLYYIHDNLYLLGTNLDISDIEFFPTLDIIGDNADLYLASGNNAIRPNRMLNEIQMLLFRMAINHERQSQGKLSINSLWLWNKAYNETTWQIISSDINAQEAIYLKQDITSDFMPNLLTQQSQTTPLLIVDQLYSSCRYRDLSTWSAILEQIDQVLGLAIKHAYQSQQLRNINIFIPLQYDTIKLSLSTSDRLKFWRHNSLKHIASRYFA